MWRKMLVMLLAVAMAIMVMPVKEARADLYSEGMISNASSGGVYMYLQSSLGSSLVVGGAIVAAMIAAYSIYLEYQAELDANAWWQAQGCYRNSDGNYDCGGDRCYQEP